MKFVVGLGNPEDKYLNTRHNIGFLFIDYMLNSIKQETNIIKRKRYHYAVWKDLVFVKPVTYMNLSGDCLKGLKGDFSGFDLRDVMVVYDDVDLAFGVIRLRKSGGAGTHNGLKSIIGAMNSGDFPRIRLGIGPKPDRMDLADYVLSPFDSTERNELDELFEQAKQGLFLWKQGRFERAMTAINKKNKPTLTEETS